MEKEFDYKTMRIESKEELKYVMDYYDIPFVPIHKDNKNMGKVTKDMKYVGGAYVFNDGFKHLAFELAFEQVKDILELKELIDKPFKATDIYHKEYDEWNYPDVEGGEPRHHVYPRTAAKEEEHEIEGATMDEVFEKHYKANNSLRYCNGYYYKFKDEKVQKLYNLWDITMPEARSFWLYYGNGTVD